MDVEANEPIQPHGPILTLLHIEHGQDIVLTIVIGLLPAAQMLTDTGPAPHFADATVRLHKESGEDQAGSFAAQVLRGATLGNIVDVVCCGCVHSEVYHVRR